jgi:hypothetical protein
VGLASTFVHQRPSKFDRAAADSTVVRPRPPMCVESILKNGLDRKALSDDAPSTGPVASTRTCGPRTLENRLQREAVANLARVAADSGATRERGRATTPVEAR